MTSHNVYHIAPNFRGTIFSWILWFEFWSRKFSAWKFSNIVGMATFCVHMRIASAIVRTCRVQYACETTQLTNVWTVKRSIKSLYRFCTLTSENEQTSLTKSARIFVQTTSFVLYRMRQSWTMLKRWPNRVRQKALKAEKKARVRFF